MRKQRTPSIVSHPPNGRGDLRSRIEEQANTPTDGRRFVSNRQELSKPTLDVRTAGLPHASNGGLPDHALCTMVVCLPLHYNPSPDGRRVAIEAEKFEETEREIRRHFSGYSRFAITGWYRDDNTGEEFVDQLLRFEVDGTFTGEQLAHLKRWKQELETRFAQRAIYFKFTGPETCW